MELSFDVREQLECTTNRIVVVVVFLLFFGCTKRPECVLPARMPAVEYSLHDIEVDGEASKRLE